MDFLYAAAFAGMFALALGLAWGCARLMGGAQ